MLWLINGDFLEEVYLTFPLDYFVPPNDSSKKKLVGI